MNAPDYTDLLERLDLMASHRVHYQNDPVAQAAAAIRDLQARLAEKEADLLSVCKRESAMIARYDAKLEALEVRLAEAQAFPPPLTDVQILRMADTALTDKMPTVIDASHPNYHKWLGRMVSVLRAAHAEPKGGA